MTDFLTPISGSELQRALARFGDARKRVRRFRYLEQSMVPTRSPGREFELRTPDGADATGDGSYTISGHAAVTGQEVVLADLGWLRIREVISVGAFDAVLATSPDVHMNINHDMRYAMARTTASGVGSLELSMDSIGLRDFARVPSAISFVRDLAVQMQSGIIDQQSFAFTIADEVMTQVDEDGVSDVLFNITEVGNLYDVCVCAQGAYPTTDSNLRGLLEAVRGRDGIDPSGLTLDTHRSGEGADESHVEPETAGGVSVAARAASLKRKRQTALSLYPERAST